MDLREFRDRKHLGWVACFLLASAIAYAGYQASGSGGDTEIRIVEPATEMSPTEANLNAAELMRQVDEDNSGAIDLQNDSDNQAAGTADPKSAGKAADGTLKASAAGSAAKGSSR